MVSKQLTPISKHGGCVIKCGKVKTCLPPVLITTWFSKHTKPDAIFTIFLGIKYVSFFDGDPNGPRCPAGSHQMLTLLLTTSLFGQLVLIWRNWWLIIWQMSPDFWKSWKIIKLICSPSKSKFFQLELEFCGHDLREEVRMPSPGKLLPLQKWELPQTVTALRSFLGITNYFSEFVPNYAEAATILMSKLQVGREDGKKG